MFIFEKAPFKSCHASTLVEHEPGKLLAAWFGGTAEGAKDVEIWSSTFDGTKWSEPAIVGTEPGQPTWNPVYFKTAKGTLYLWYKAGPSPERFGHLHHIAAVPIPSQPDLGGDRDVGDRAHGAHDPFNQRHILQQGRPCAARDHLAHRAAHVDIDDVGALGVRQSRQDPRGLRHAGRVGAEKLDKIGRAHV